MTAHRFSAGKRFHWQNRLYEVKRLLAKEQKVSVEDVVAGDALLLDLHTLVEALFRDELEFEADNHTNGKTKRPTLDLSDYPPHLVEVARWRLRAIKPLLELNAGRRTRAAVAAQVEEVKTWLASQPEAAGLRASASVMTFYRWIKDYEKSDGDLRTLIPKTRERGGKGKARLTPAVNAIVDSIIQDNYYRPERVTLQQIAALTAARLEEENRLLPAAEQYEMPSFATIARRLAALDAYGVAEAKHGKHSAQNKFAQVGQMEYPKLPLERVEIDHTRTDIIVIDENDNLPLGRPTLTHCLDGATRFPLGYYLGFEPPSYYAVMECLYHAISPKINVREKYETEHDWIAYGIPSLLIIDNGKEFIGNDLADACQALGITLEQCPVKTPELKAVVERMVGTLNTGLFHGLPGTTFSNIAQRGDYDSVGKACVSLSELEAALNIFLVDIYAEGVHRKLDGIPARRWEALAAGFSPRLPPNRQELLALLGRVDYRAINRDGIYFESLRYNCGELGSLRARLKGEKAKIKYHPGDLSRLYVFDTEHGYIEVPALDQTYTSHLSLWKHRVIRRWARLEGDVVDMAALGRAVSKIQQIVDTARSRKRTGTRSKIARWDNAGQAPSLAEQTKPSMTLLLPPPAISATASDNLPPSVSVTETVGFDFDYSLPKSRRE